MKPPLTIIAATDFSEPAGRAVERSFRLSGLVGGELHILHGLELDTLDSLREMLGKGELTALKARMEANARDQLDQLINSLANPQGMAAHPRVVIGNPLSAIPAEADALDAGLIVLGARGESILRHAILGSTAARLLRKSVRRPVLVVKQRPYGAYHSVLVAVDFSPVSVQAIRMARRLAPGADLILLHVFELPYEGKLTFAGVEPDVIQHYIRKEQVRRRKQLHQLAEEAGLQPTAYMTSVIHGNPSLQIVSQEQEQNCDLIVLGKHGAHLTEELLLGSVTKHVLAESRGDVLVICDPRGPTDAFP